MVDYPEQHRIAGIQVATVRINMMGGMGNYAKYALCDEDSRPMAFVMSQKFSERTEALFEELRESLERDAHDIFANRGRPASDHRSPPETDF